MKYTDRNIPVECAECPVICEGFEQILGHILEAHSETYNQEEAIKYAEIWVDNAYPERAQEMRDYEEDRKLDRAIDADTFTNK